MDTNRQGLRIMAKNLRAKVSGAKKHEFSKKIVRTLFDTPEFQKATGVLCYASTDEEVATKLIIKKCLDTGKLLALPKVCSPTQMQAIKVDKNTQFTTSKWGISEPKIGDDLTDKIDENWLIIVPMLAYSNKLERMGYGAGYYDRFLQKCPAKFVGLAFSVQEILAGFSESHDINMHKIITEKGVLA